MAKKVLGALKRKFRGAIIATRSDYGDEVATVERDKLLEIATWLRDDAKMAFDSPVFCTCIDNLGEDGPRYKVCYQLRSSTKLARVRLEVLVDEDDPSCPSLAGLWPGFGWLERETYDMYGIQFEGHEDLRRIYLYEEFVGHPLRKDYPKDKRQPLVRRDDLPKA